MVNKYLKRKQNGGEAPVEPKKDSPYEKAVSFEVTREELFLASERKAWRYTVLLGVLSVILANKHCLSSLKSTKTTGTQPCSRLLTRRIFLTRK